MKLDSAFTLENASWPVLLIDAAANVVHANAMAIKTFGAALEAPRSKLSEIWMAEGGGSPETFFAKWEHSPLPAVSLKFRAQNGTAGTFLTSICPAAQEGQKFFLLQLVSENASSELAQKQKLDCALQLARTVSLDFNNALTSILGHVSLLLSKTEASHPMRASLLEIEKSAERAAEIAGDLGAFSLQEKEARTQAAGNLNLILQRAVDLFRNNAHGQKILWTLQLERKLFAAKFDEAKIQQAFVKILENAVQSVGAEGRITVSSRGLELTEASQDRNARLSPGAYVCLEISDNGSGIEPEVLPRIFEPFFTTKKPPHRGLGLAWVYGIVTNHGGGVAVSSQTGSGTSVRVYLPAEKRFVRDNAINLHELGGDQTVLMVDDEDLMLTMGATVLSAYGYRVLTANNGAKALEILARAELPVDLVITDLVMPLMSGRELVERVQQVSPTTHIICTSGFVRPAGQSDDARYLQKPFTSQQLLSKVKQVLAAETVLTD